MLWAVYRVAARAFQFISNNMRLKKLDFSLCLPLTCHSISRPVQHATPSKISRTFVWVSSRKAYTRCLQCLCQFS
jgi:hypothetical protein